MNVGVFGILSPQTPTTMATATTITSECEMSKKLAKLTEQASFPYSWRRQTRIRGIGTRGLIGEVVYFAPCGKKLKSVPEVARVSTFLEDRLYFRCMAISTLISRNQLDFVIDILDYLYFSTLTKMVSLTWPERTSLTVYG